jgi:short-subunit dehydrogenase
MQLDGKRVFMTGGAGGIGLVLAQQLRQAGALVTTIDRQQGADIVADLSSEELLSRLCAQMAQENADILVNLAGLMYFGHFPSQPQQHLTAMLRVNLEAPLRLAQAVIPGMGRRGRGQIVNIGSVFGAIPFPHFVAYSTTKAGLKAFSESLNREYAGKGITVTHIAPRAVRTPLNGGLIAELHKRTGVVSDEAEKVADTILRAIVKDTKSAVIGFPESFFAKLNAVLPGVVDGALTAKRDIADLLLNEYSQEKEKNDAKAA